MRVVIQRVKNAQVSVKNRCVAKINKGLLLLVGFNHKDIEVIGTTLWDKIINKIPHLRIFPDKDGKFNLSLIDVDGEILVVSQFTLYGDLKRGRRPSFSIAAHGDVAKKIYERFVKDLESIIPGRVKQGIFGENMAIDLCNFGPVTLILDSDEV